MTIKTAEIEVALTDWMGDDLKVVNAARTSFKKRQDTFREQDARLIQYLARGMPSGDYEALVSDVMRAAEEGRRDDVKKMMQRYRNTPIHFTSFAHCAATFRLKIPFFVARQLGKHQIGLVLSEVSRRYVDDEPEFYIPRPRARAANLKQGSSDAEVPRAALARLALHTSAKQARNCYQNLLLLGVAPEVARVVLTQHAMTEWTWTGSLMAMARVFMQRMDPHAQEETRQVARLMGEQMAPRFQVSWAALTEGAGG